jgi:hypothetical protein
MNGQFFSSGRPSPGEDQNAIGPMHDALSPREWTLAVQNGMSALGQKRTLATREKRKDRLVAVDRTIPPMRRAVPLDESLRVDTAKLFGL